MSCVRGSAREELADQAIDQVAAYTRGVWNGTERRRTDRRGAEGVPDGNGWTGPERRRLDRRGVPWRGAEATTEALA